MCVRVSAPQSPHRSKQSRGTSNAQTTATPGIHPLQDINNARVQGLSPRAALQVRIQ